MTRTYSTRFVGFLFLAVCLASPATHLVVAQQTRGPYEDVRELPEGAVGEVITRLIETINANDAERVKTFFDEHVADEFRAIAPMEQHIQVARQLYEQTRGLEFYAVRKYEQATPEDEVVVIVRNKLTEGWQALVINVQPEPPHLMTSLGISPARPPSDLPEMSKLTQDEIVQQLEAFVDRLAEADAFSGTVLLAKDGKVLFEAAHGLASKRFDVPVRIDTKFNLGSMNKMFTCVAITQLVQLGKLSLDDQLSHFVGDDWLPQVVADKIQIKHLLTHTSGLGSYFNDTYQESSKALFRELDDYRPLVADSTLSFEPGSDWQYSNTGMFLLGVVIEKVSGQNYFDYIRQHIHEPAGMPNSDCYDMDRPVANLAIGYSKGDGQWQNNLYMHVIRGGPAGGGFSTVGDLLNFDRALRGHQLLDAEHTELVWSAKPDMKSPSYGFGFAIHGTPDDRIVGHSGGFSGINSNLDMFLDSGFTAVVMSNYSGGAMPIVEKIRELIRHRRPDADASE